MINKTAVRVVSCFTVSVAIVALLFVLSGQMKDSRNSFLRQFPPHPIAELDTIPIKYNSYYIAGGTPHTVYFGNSVAPLRALILNHVTQDTQRIGLSIEGIAKQKFWSTSLHIDSPYYYVTDGTIPIIFKGDLGDRHGNRYLTDSIYFQKITPMHPGSFGVKSLSGTTGENIVGKLTAWPPYHSFNDSILQKQQDGVFCTDGMLRFNEELNRLIYLYYYRNQFMVMDTSLNLLYRGNTIDTTSIAKIKTATVESGNWKTLASPPYFVNRLCDASGQWLFVNSNLLAKNEHPDAFKLGSVIDLYNLNSGAYVFSFYIYHFQGKRMNEFRVFGDKLVVRFDNILMVYYLKSEYFKELTERV